MSPLAWTRGARDEEAKNAQEADQLPTVAQSAMLNATAAIQRAPGAPEYLANTDHRYEQLIDFAAYPDCGMPRRVRYSPGRSRAGVSSS
jgi:hypothetical protein